MPDENTTQKLKEIDQKRQEAMQQRQIAIQTEVNKLLHELYKGEKTQKLNPTKTNKVIAEFTNQQDRVMKKFITIVVTAHFGMHDRISQQRAMIERITGLTNMSWNNLNVLMDFVGEMAEALEYINDKEAYQAKLIEAGEALFEKARAEDQETTADVVMEHLNNLMKSGQLNPYNEHQEGEASDQEENEEAGQEEPASESGNEEQAPQEEGEGS